MSSNEDKDWTYQDSRRVTAVTKAMENERLAREMQAKAGTGRQAGEYYEAAARFYTEAGNIPLAKECFRNARIYGYTTFDHDAVKMKEEEDELRRKQCARRDAEDAESELTKGAKKLVNILRKKERLISNASAITSILAFSASIFFITIGITGKVILGAGEFELRNFSLCFFLCGLILTLVYLDSKKKFRKKK